MIRKVMLDGFKGYDSREYELDRALAVLNGPNGSGKSACLQAIRYALKGDVPGGRNNDAVARLFGTAGGTVELSGDEESWLERGVVVDHERAKVSAVARTSDDELDGDREILNLERWESSTFGLELRELFELSPEKRREAVLRICGASDSADVDEIVCAIAEGFAREVAGPAASAATLEDPSDLSDELRALCSRWGELERALRAAAVGKEGITKTIAALESAAKDEQLVNGKAARDAKAAARELEREVKGAEAAAADLARLESSGRMGREALQRMREDLARCEEVDREISQATSAFARWSTERVESLAALDLLGDPGDKPEPARDGWSAEQLNELREEVAAIESEIRHCHDEIAKVERRRAERARDVEERTRELDGVVKQITAIRARPTFELRDRAHRVPLHAHPEIEEIRGLTRRLCLADEKAVAELEKRGTGLSEQIESATKSLDALTQDEPEGSLALFEPELAAKSRELEELEDKEREHVRYRLAELNSWREEKAAFDEAKRRYEFARTNEQGAQDRIELAKARRQEIESGGRRVDSEAVESAAASLEEVSNSLALAREAAGKVAAYNDAIERCERHQVLENAWKKARAAVRAVREEFVGNATAPLVRRANELLEQSGRRERIFLRLENDRGARVFELGWTTPAGETVQLSALSGGQTVVLCALLAAAIVEREEVPLRVLLIEADPCDPETMGQLLQALAPVAGTIDNVVVATALESVPEVDGWSVHRLEVEAREGAAA